MKTTRTFPCNVDCPSVTAIALLAVAFVAVLPASASDASVSTSSGQLISVDFRENTCRAVAPAKIGYSPKWSGIDESGSYVVLQKVEYADMPNVITNTLATFAADEESCFVYTVSDGDERCIRFLHRTYSSGGEEIGEPLVRDVSFGYRSETSADFAADSRTNSLQSVIDAGGTVNLAYSTEWATNASDVSIKAVQLSDAGGAPVATNSIFYAIADAKGVTAMRGVGRGWWKLLYQVMDGSDNVLLEYLTGEFKMKGGFVMCLR